MLCREGDLAVGAALQRFMGDHRIERQRGIDVREKLAAPAFLPAHRVAIGRQVDGGDVQILLSGEMAVDRFGKLGGSREVDVPIGQIDGRALETAAPSKRPRPASSAI